MLYWPCMESCKPPVFLKYSVVQKKVTVLLSNSLECPLPRLAVTGQNLAITFLLNSAHEIDIGKRSTWMDVQIHVS